MKTAILLLVAAMGLGGCATNDYALYAESNAKMQIAKSNAESEKYKAMSAIAASGTEAAKVAAVMAIALGGQATANGAAQLSAPQQSNALQWAQVLVPGLTQVAGIAANMRVATVQSNNATTLGVSTNESFVGIAGKIQAPAANNTTTTTETLSGTGVLGSGTYNTTDSHNNVPVVVTPVVQVTPTVINPTIVPPVVTQNPVVCTDVGGVVTCK